jgi:hypothetical protein
MGNSSSAGLDYSAKNLGTPNINSFPLPSNQTQDIGMQGGIKTLEQQEQNIQTEQQKLYTQHLKDNQQLLQQELDKAGKPVELPIMKLLPPIIPIQTPTSKPIMNCLDVNKSENQGIIICKNKISGDDCPSDIKLTINENQVTYKWVSDKTDITNTVCRRYISCDSVGPTDDSVCYETKSTNDCPSGWSQYDSSPYCYKI